MIIMWEQLTSKPKILNLIFYYTPNMKFYL